MRIAHNPRVGRNCYSHCNSARISRGEGLRRLLRKAVLIGLPLVATTARAQQYPRVELSAGFSYANVSLGSQSPVFAPTGRNYYGGGFAVSVNPTRYLRVLVLDLSVESGRSAFAGEGSLTTAQALFGPQFVFRRQKLSGFADGLFGVAQYQLGVCTIPGQFYPQCNAVSPHYNIRNNLALGFGGGLDVNLSRHFAARLVQADFVPTLIAGHWQNTFRVNTGLVFRFAWSRSR